MHPAPGTCADASWLQAAHTTAGGGKKNMSDENHTNKQESNNVLKWSNGDEWSSNHGFEVAIKPSLLHNFSMNFTSWVDGSSIVWPLSINNE